MRACYLFLLPVLLAGCASSQQPELLWVGHLAPLSGPDRNQGEQAVSAMNHALEQARQEGFTVAGHPLGIRHADSAKGTPRAEAVRLLAVNGVRTLLVGPGVAKPEEVVAAGRLHGALVVVLDEMADVPREKSVVLLAADPARRGEALAEFAREKLKPAKVAVVVDEDRPICAAVADAFARAWKSKGELRRWRLADLKEKSQVDDLSRWKPSLTLLAVGAKRPAGLEETLTGLAAGSVVLYGGEDRDEPPSWLVAPPGGVPKGEPGPSVYTVSACSSLAKLPEESRTLLDSLRKKQGHEPGRTAVLALDTVRLLQRRGELLRDLDRQRDPEKRLKLLDEQAALEEFDSVTGTMSWKEGRPIRPLFLVRYQGGKGKLVHEVPAKR